MYYERKRKRSEKIIIVCDSVLSGARDKWTKSERQICREFALWERREGNNL